MKMTHYRSNILSVVIVVVVVLLGMRMQGGKQEAGFSYLALGDSYTTGAFVHPAATYPRQAVGKLRAMGVNVQEPTLVAMPGWTTTMLLRGLSGRDIKDTFSVVSLLIGTNNMFGGDGLAEYKVEFEELVQRAIGLAGGRSNRVIVLSIPDLSATPYGARYEGDGMAKRVVAFNEACKAIALQHGCSCIDQLEGSRERGNKREYIAEDGLHVTEKEYAIWADALAKEMYAVLQTP